MLYHYYMKINLKLFAIGLCFLFSFLYAHAQVTVVKQDGQKIYLDTSEYNRTISVGDSFKIILSQEKLVNPKTGKDLGLVNHYSVEGKITEVQPMYVIGEIPGKTHFTVGQEAVIENTVVPQNAQQDSQQQQAAAPISNRKMITYDAIEREIISAVQADLTDDEKEEIAALDTKGDLVIYKVQGNTLQEIAQQKLPTGYKPITLSAQNIMDHEKAQLFAVGYKENEQKISTFVFELQNTTLKQIELLPYFVKELGCGDDKEIYAQRPLSKKNFPATLIN